MKDRAQVSIFAQGDTTCAVCAPGGTPRQFVIGYVEARNPTPAGSPGWRVFGGSLPDGGSNPRTCPHDRGRSHWFLVRGDWDADSAGSLVARREGECFT